MSRMTQKRESATTYFVETSQVSKAEVGYIGEAIEKLACFENIVEELTAKQEEISKELETLRNQGKKNTAKFKELMGKKLSNSMTLSLFQAYGVD